MMMDVRSTTGKNLRYLKLKTANFSEKKFDAYEEPYKTIPTNEMWRIPMIEELIEAKNGERSIMLTTTEMDDLVHVRKRSHIMSAAEGGRGGCRKSDIC